MRKDDSSLGSAEQQLVEAAAHRLLERADAIGVVPVPIDDLLAAAKLKLAPYSVFDPRSIAAYALVQGKKAASLVKRAVGKIFGVLDAHEEIIHIDDTVSPGRQLFLKLHETGHFELPHQRKLFRFFEESEQELDPSVADRFEREANNFARYAMFNGSAFAERAADMPLCFGSVKKIHRSFGVSLYAGLREYVRTHGGICIGFAVEETTACPIKGWRADIRRFEVSPQFAEQFGRPRLTSITKGHPFACLLPYGKATKPTQFLLTDLNGENHSFIGEALKTPFNTLLFAGLEATYKR